MKKVQSFLFRHKIASAFFAIFLLLPLVYSSFTLAKTDIKNDLNVVKAHSEGSCCLWFQHTNYFNDANHLDAAGVRHYFCNGEIGGWGSVTPYYEDFYCECYPDNNKSK